MDEPYVCGKVVSASPIITFSSRTTELPLGIPSGWPELSRGKPALHFIAFSFTMESDEAADALAADFRALQAQLPGNSFVVATNSEFEAYLLAKRGVPSMLVNHSIFLSEQIYRPQKVEPRFDALYNARLARFKRHELARSVQNLGLLYDLGPETAPSLYGEIKALLPHAVFVNHEEGGGEFLHLTRERCADVINQARVGLCLSAAEGAMRAALEYMLCGLPVVSTQSVGGRDRYFMPPFCRVVPDDPELIAAAVRELAAAKFPKAAIRAATLELLEFDRHNFLIAVNRIVEQSFGTKQLFSSFAPFATGLTQYARPADALAKLRAA
jgi:glycosyltransferase involved in cell wall biosynthesis